MPVEPWPPYRGDMENGTARPPAAGDADLAAVGSVLAEPARARILLALGDGRALPASVLAAEAGVSPSTTSTHLTRLLHAGLVSCRPQGRHRYYELAGPQVAELIEVVARLAPPAPVRSLRQGNRAAAVRAARTCYDHLAGRLGVELFAALIQGGFVTGGDGVHRPEAAVRDRLSARGHDIDYRLTEAGGQQLRELGVPLPPRSPDGIGLRYCVDWTEQRHHLGGSVGRGLTARLLELGWLRRAPRGRAVHLTDEGDAHLRETFGLGRLTLTGQTLTG